MMASTISKAKSVHEHTSTKDKESSVLSPLVQAKCPTTRDSQNDSSEKFKAKSEHEHASKNEEDSNVFACAWKCSSRFPSPC